MDTVALLRKIQALEIKTRGLTKQVFSGEYHAAFKGRGMAFSEVRDYQIGDDVRSIDWNVTARLNNPYVKVFEEERELVVMLMIDVSESIHFGTKKKTKKELAIELAAILSFSAISNHDKIGAIFVSDQVEKYIAPKKGKNQVLMILRELIEFQPTSKKTDVLEGLRFLRNTQKKRTITFVMSDFFDNGNFLEAFKLTNRKHDVVALKLEDEAEYQLPNIGIIPVFNAETEQLTWMDTATASVQNQFTQAATVLDEQLKAAFLKAKIDLVSIRTDDDYIPVLMNFFKRRGK